MTMVLISIYDLIFVGQFMILKGQNISITSIEANLFSFLDINTIISVPFASCSKHILASLAMFVTISLGFYGRLKKETEDLLDATQLVEKV
jgi:uncharacterized membrane protein YkvI